MSTIQEIERYLGQNTRNKIVFCRTDIEGIHFVNIGHALSLLLKDMQEGIYSMSATELLSTITCQSDERIGQYVAIENIGILFEPELKIDFRNFLDANSKNQCLVIKTEAEIKEDRFYFLKSQDSLMVNLKGLSHIII